MSDEANLDAYLKRINFSGSIAPSLVTLKALHQLHPATIPFETLDPLMGLPVRLQLSDIEQKLVFERRGGYCFEHNMLFHAVLDSLGFAVTPLAARVLWGHEEDEVRPLSHMVLTIDIAGVTYLADVGFGGQTLTAPLLLEEGLEQETPNERYRLNGGAASWRLDIDIGGVFRPLYSFDLTTRTPEEYREMNERTAISFSDTLVAARSEEAKRHALKNNRLHTHEKGGETTTRMLLTVPEIRDVLTNVFGIALPTSDRLDGAIEKVLAAAETV